MKSVIVLCFYFSKVHTVTLLKQKKYHVFFFFKTPVFLHFISCFIFVTTTWCVILLMILIIQNIWDDLIATSNIYINIWVCTYRTKLQKYLRGTLNINHDDLHVTPLRKFVCTEFVVQMFSILYVMT